MKKLLIILMTAFMIVTMTGCGNKSEKIVIYTCQEEERIQSMKKAIAEKFPELNIVVEPMGTGNLAAKIKTEGNNVEADIIIDLEMSHCENLKANFADLSSFDTSMFLDGGVSADNKYVMWVKNYAGITVNKKMFAENGWSYPTSYEDLLDSKYVGLIAMPSPSTSGTGYSWYLNVVNLKGQEGALKYFEDLSKNIKQFTTGGSGPISLLNQGEIAIAMGMSFQGAAAITNGSDYEIVELDTGVPYNMTAATIISGRETKENVAEVFQYLIGEWHYVDVEEFVPGDVLKNQTTKVPNWPTITKDADMTGIKDIDLKSLLQGKWDLS